MLILPILRWVWYLHQAWIDFPEINYIWFGAETALPICLPGIILGALPFIGTSIIASIAAVIVSAILSFAIAYALDKITPIFFRSP